MIHCGNEIKSFSEKEFPEGVHEFADPMLMLKLQRQRDLLGHSISPSMAEGALARLGRKNERTGNYVGTTGVTMKDYVTIFGKKPSMHQVMSDKKSTAIDVFCDCNPFEAFCKIMQSGLWQGIGVYFDTNGNDGKRHVMFHLDFGRDGKLLWYRAGARQEYFYEATSEGFYRELCFNFSLYC